MQPAFRRACRSPFAGPTITNLADSRLRAILDPRRLVRWGYLARLSLAGAIYVAAVYEWNVAAVRDTLTASLACVVALAVTAVSAAYSEIGRRPLTRPFLYAQSVFDLLLVTTVVHLTGGLSSQFSALYILVFAAAALLLSAEGSFFVTALGLALYLADGLVVHHTGFDLAAGLQFVVFAVVSASTGYISVRLKEVGSGQQELAAELAHARLEASDILHNIRSGIVTVSAQGQLLYANAAAGALLGLDLSRATGRDVLPLIAGHAPELARALARGVDDGARTTRAEGSITAGGRTFPVGVTTTVADAGERGATVTAIFQDLSESKRLEALRRRAERLEAVAALSASLAHEIKNPLASIRSAVEQLALAPDADEDDRTLGELIVRESDRLSRLLSEFLDFARVRMRRVDAVDLGEVARGAAALAASHPDRRPGVTVRCAAPQGVVVVEGDADLLHRAVFNLALNAVQAMHAAGEVLVEVAPVEQDGLPGGVVFDRGAVALRVSDTGTGIAPEVRDRLFDPFITTKPGGTGLGLPVVHRAIEAHRGLVFVDSDRSGTRFTVLLPVHQPEEQGTGNREPGTGNGPAEATVDEAWSPDDWNDAPDTAPGSTRHASRVTRHASATHRA